MQSKMPKLLRCLVVCLIPSLFMECNAQQENNDGVELTPETVVVSDSSSFRVERMGDDSLLLKSSRDISKVAAGTIVVGEHNGTRYLRKVVSTQVNSDGTMSARTEQASLDEAINVGSVSVSEKVRFSGGDSIANERITGFAKVVDKSDYAVLHRTDIDILLNKLQVDFDPDVNLELEYRRGLQKFRAVVSGRLDVDLQAGIAIGQPFVDVEFAKEVDEIPGTPIYFSIGVVPVEVLPVLEVSVGVRAHANASGEARCEAGLSLTATTGVEFADGEWSLIGDTMREFRSPKLTYEIAGEADIQVFARVQVVFKFYRVAGPYIGVTGGLGFDTTTTSAANDSIDWQLYWALEGVAGGKVKVLSKRLVDIDFELFEIRSVLSEGSLALPCMADSDCDDGKFCTGEEKCLQGICTPGEFPCTPLLMCDELIGGCVECIDEDDCGSGTQCIDGECKSDSACTTDADCNDGRFCNGQEECLYGTCQAGPAPCSVNCDESLDRCVACLTNDDCDDDLYCNGAELCVDDECVGGVAPCASGQTCNEADRTCIQPPLNEPTIVLDLGAGVEIELSAISAGSFAMGDSTYGYSNETPVHSVQITAPFYIGKYEITQAQWLAVMPNNPSFNTQWADLPVDDVSWEEAMEYCNTLSLMVGRTVRLPTEAEWEYCCRAGTSTTYSFGDSDANLGEYAWHIDNTPTLYKTQRVGIKEHNAWSLYDMHGNVSEWCADWYGETYYQVSPKNDPQGPNGGTGRVLRGGSACASSDAHRSAGRSWGEPWWSSPCSGFRIVLEAD